MKFNEKVKSKLETMNANYIETKKSVLVRSFNVAQTVASKIKNAEFTESDHQFFYYEIYENKSIFI